MTPSPNSNRLLFLFIFENGDRMGDTVSEFEFYIKLLLITFIDGYCVCDTVSGVEYDTGGTTGSVEGEHGLDGDVHGGGIEGLEHDLRHLFPCWPWGWGGLQWAGRGAPRGLHGARCRRCDARSSPYRPSLWRYRVQWGTSGWGYLSCSGPRLLRSCLSVPYRPWHPGITKNTRH